MLNKLLLSVGLASVLLVAMLDRAVLETDDGTTNAADGTTTFRNNNELTAIAMLLRQVNDGVDGMVFLVSMRLCFGVWLDVVDGIVDTLVLQHVGHVTCMQDP